MKRWIKLAAADILSNWPAWQAEAVASDSWEDLFLERIAACIRGYAPAERENLQTPALPSTNSPDGRYGMPWTQTHEAENRFRSEHGV